MTIATVGFCPLPGWRESSRRFFFGPSFSTLALSSLQKSRTQHSTSALLRSLSNATKSTYLGRISTLCMMRNRASGRLQTRWGAQTLRNQRSAMLRTAKEAAPNRDCLFV